MKKEHIEAVDEARKTERGVEQDFFVRLGKKREAVVKLKFSPLPVKVRRKRKRRGR